MNVRLYVTSIREWQRQVHALAKSKGWWEGAGLDVPNIASKLLMVHAEVSEATEALRVGDLRSRVSAEGKPEGLGVELADVVIRVLDLAEALGIDLESEMQRKHEYNAGRSYQHGGKAL